MATAVLRNALGIPLWLAGLALAWRAPLPLVFPPGSTGTAIAGLLLAVGLVVAIWGHVLLGWRTHMPSIRDTLVRHGLYAYVRHPIYSGIMLALAGLVLLRPTSTVILAAAVAGGAFLVQARLEEVDLRQRLPGYREYIGEVPRFIPRVGRRARKVRRNDPAAGA
jgi:protein-S-isoprenylcysteine O-methyltransferase Ste14